MVLKCLSTLYVIFFWLKFRKFLKLEKNDDKTEHFEKKALFLLKGIFNKIGGRTISQWKLSVLFVLLLLASLFAQSSFRPILQLKFYILGALVPLKYQNWYDSKFLYHFSAHLREFLDFFNNLYFWCHLVKTWRKWNFFGSLENYFTDHFMRFHPFLTTLSYVDVFVYVCNYQSCLRAKSVLIIAGNSIFGTKIRAHKELRGFSQKQISSGILYFEQHHKMLHF